MNTNEKTSFSSKFKEVPFKRIKDMEAYFLGKFKDEKVLVSLLINDEEKAIKSASCFVGEEVDNYDYDYDTTEWLINMETILPFLDTMENRSFINVYAEDRSFLPQIAIGNLIDFLPGGALAGGHREWFFSDDIDNADGGGILQCECVELWLKEHPEYHAYGREHYTNM